MNEINSQLIKEIRENPKIRRRVAFQSPLWFSLHYLRHHFTHPLAPFHIELFHLLAQQEHELIAIMAFRESGKSTIMNTANVLWSILGKPEKKFVLIVSKTQEQAKNHFANIKAELRNNELLKHDFGPFLEPKEEWNKLSLEMEYHGAKIMSVTKEQSVRGMKHGQYRPDLIVCDDLEDMSSARDPNESDSLYQRFASEFVPLGSMGTRIILLGNLLSVKSFLMRIKEDIMQEKISGIFRAYPLLDEMDKMLWQSKFPDLKSIERLASKVTAETWSREYLLDLSGRSSGYTSRRYSPDDPYDAISLRTEQKLAEVYLEYQHDLIHAGHMVLQVPLTETMKGFRIAIPTPERTPPNPGDRGYEKYQLCEQKVKVVVREFEDELYRLEGRKRSAEEIRNETRSEWQLR